MVKGISKISSKSSSSSSEHLKVTKIVMKSQMSDNDCCILSFYFCISVFVLCDCVYLHKYSDDGDILQILILKIQENSTLIFSKKINKIV